MKRKVLKNFLVGKNKKRERTKNDNRRVKK